jgi:hypothetical protein
MTLKSHIDNINPSDNVIIGLGDSFTQGVGAYSLSTWNSIEKNASLYNISGQYFVEEQGQNNWVRQLGNNFLSNYKTMSLGVNGAGNRAAIKELYLNPLPDNVGNVVVILMATGVERYDFLKNDKVTSGPENHQKWKTIWPTLSSKREGIGDLEKQYATHVWSQKTDAMEFILNVAEAQMFCKSKNYKFLFGSAFDSRINKEWLQSKLDDDAEQWINMIDWNNYICPENCEDFMHYVRKLENHPDITDFYGGQLVMSKMSTPLKYLTPCYHWTIDGAYEVAKEIHNILKIK